MPITPIEEATAYSAPLPPEVFGLRLQGHDATSTENIWGGLSHFLPGDSGTKRHAVREGVPRHRGQGDDLGPTMTSRSLDRGTRALYRPMSSA